MARPITESQVLLACQTLFGSEIPASRAFLQYLQPSGVKSAYRRKAKETHPDIIAGTDPGLQKQQSLLFVEILKAYDVLNAFFKQRERGLWRLPAATPPRTRARPRPHAGTTQRPDGNADLKRPRPIPKRPLEFGRYLYYRGCISYKTLIEAVTWQRIQRPAIGDIALQWGWLNSIGIQQVLNARHVFGRFGEKAVGLGLLSSFQVKTLLYFQRSQQERLGRYFVLNGFLSQHELDRLVADLDDHNARILSDMLRTSRTTGSSR